MDTNNQEFYEDEEVQEIPVRKKKKKKGLIIFLVILIPVSYTHLQTAIGIFLICGQV